MKKKHKKRTKIDLKIFHLKKSQTIDLRSHSNNNKIKLDINFSIKKKDVNTANSNCDLLIAYERARSNNASFSRREVRLAITSAGSALV